MSLLLDALKKAEEEKAKASQDDEAEDLLEKTGEFFQASIQEELKASGLEDGLETPIKAAPSPIPNLSLEPLSGSENKDESINEVKSEAIIPTEVNPVELLEGLEPETSEEQVADDTLTGLSSKELINDIGDSYNSTPVAAQTVFKAGIKRGTKKNYNTILLLSLCFIGLFGFVASYYFKVKPLSTNKTVPQTIVKEQTSPLNESVETEPLPSQSEATEVNNSESLTQENTEDAQQENNIVEVVDNDIVESVKSNETIPAESISINTTENKVVETVANVETAQKENRLERLPEDIKPPKSGIKISKKKQTELTSQLINRGYIAFQSGSYTEAEQFYLEALKSDRKNRDVLLGLAAVALKKGDKELAYIHYLNLLDSNPNDEAAITGLLSVSNKGVPKNNLELIQSLQKKKPEASHLDYILGNQYAKLQQWTKAQEAYFTAYSKDTFNPDYAFNLAVSLDQIGQYKSALNYYYSALELAEKRNANFAPGPVFSRIDILTAQLQKIQ